MNTQRRKEIASVIDQLQELTGHVEDLGGEEQEYFDNMPESFQQGEKGELALSAISNLEEAVDALNEAINQLEEAVQ